ncbi:hypothetical protein LOK49_LG06G01651 [Camellia lanceoleosa]|uniref:Uncharacterized protein n=1 Tax=Camellia lanceoleosa TaxID=1840588 RepID=A0ACC0HC43_9ERIC|nr:hypothetical protein LOK49_LG06G01651 [Camellia lanceoleosa]
MFHFAYSMALKSAVELRIADIIHSRLPNHLVPNCHRVHRLSFSRCHLPLPYHEVAGPQKDLHRYSSIRRWRGSLRAHPHVQMAITRRRTQPSSYAYDGERSQGISPLALPQQLCERRWNCIPKGSWP